MLGCISGETYYVQYKRRIIDLQYKDRTIDHMDIKTGTPIKCTGLDEAKMIANNMSNGGPYKLWRLTPNLTNLPDDDPNRYHWELIED